MARRYQSAVDRLRALPPVFSGRDLTVLFQWSAATASTYLTNWRRAGLVRPLGGHSDVFMNLVVQPTADLHVALRRALPEAMLIGMDVLREAGWTTQVQHAPDVAILTSSPDYKLPDFRLQRRPARWFDRVSPGITDAGTGLRRLAPAWALADMLHRRLDGRVRDAWLPAPDDLDFEVIRAGGDGGEPALAAFGLPPGAFTDGGYSSLYDAAALKST